MKIFVTGGAGYIGSHVCKMLAQHGHTVVVYDNLSTGHREFVQWGEFEYGDITDYAKLFSALKRHQPNAIIHFAASAYVGESVLNPGKYFRNNVTGTLTILEAMRDANVKNIVVSGTCAVYGQPDKLPIQESCPTNPINPYGASKLFMERMLADFATAHDIHWLSLRYFNAAGCDLEGIIGERHTPETHLIPNALGALLPNHAPLSVFGNDYPTRDGTCIRDYIHVQDLADAHIKGAQYLQNGGANRFLNLGTGTGTSIKELIVSIEKNCGKNLPILKASRREGDPAELVANARQAKEILGWEIQHSDIDTIVRSAWNWMCKENSL